MRGEQAPAESRYRGLRLTVTQSPDSSYCFAALAVKQATGRWDEWSLILPAVRIAIDPDAQLMLQDVLSLACEAVREQVENG